MAKSIIFGTGFGSLYKTILQNLGQEVITVDPNGQADYTDFSQVPKQEFLTAHICSPNYTHYSLARQVAPYSKIVFVEKPGFENYSHWNSIQDEFPTTRFMMTKNNQYRDNIDELITLASKTNNIHLHWINFDRIPNPGSWFTNKDLSYGGVEKDLVPHLLSLLVLLEPNYKKINWKTPITFRNWRLRDLSSTDYGQVNAQGEYNVSDRFEISGTTNYLKQYHIRADWRSMTHTDVGIHFGPKFIELGLCPESAYEKMITTAIDNLNNNQFWTIQKEQDVWIQQMI